MQSILTAYAKLLVDYCLEIQQGDNFFISTTTLAEPLVREIYRTAMRKGANVEVEFSFRERNRIFLAEAKGEQLNYVSPLYRKAMEEFDAYLNIRAPYNLRENQNVDPEKRKKRQDSLEPVRQAYFKRTATRAMRRCLCQYPTQAAAQEAGMSLEEYEQFVFDACQLYEDDPVQAWLDVREQQQQIVDFLNTKTTVQYKNGHTDIQFSTDGRTWINSDGRTNMPSGEIYTSPVEDSVQGVIHFDYPGIYMGHEVEGVTLWVKDGWIEKWEAHRGKDFLDQIFAMKGARRFGEAAIGNNFKVSKMTKNVLFDEKIGGTVHMAIGQGYLQAGGKNESSVHWDMITSMQDDGEIYADGEKIYEKGQFLIF